MNTINAPSFSKGKVIGKKSWTAYVAVVILTVLVSGGGIVISFEEEMWLAGCLIIVVSLALGILRIYTLRSYQIVIDKNGVWIFRGVLPWTKGFSGVKWRDLDEAVYCQSLMGWLLKSYTIVLTHRFTKTDEIKMYETDRGDEVVSLINRVHTELLNSNSIKNV